MASIQTFIKESPGDLVVVPLFNTLMKESVSKDSVYIRSKETMQEFFTNSNMSDPDKANILSQLLVNMTTQMTEGALNAAIQIAKENRDAPYQLAASREDTLLKQEQRDKLAEDRANVIKEGNLIDQKTKDLVIAGWVKQATIEKENGVVLDNLPTLDTTTNLTGTMVSDKGVKWEQTEQTKMSVYATLAKSFRESGTVTWTTDATTGRVNTITDAVPTAPGLTKRQEQVAIRQEKAFDDNKVQHAANSSANMIGLLLSSADSGAITTTDVTKWRTAVDYLNTPTP